MTQVSPLEGHDLWAPVYDSAVNPIVLLERRSTLELLGNLRPSTLLDVACGTGYWLRHFDRAGSTVFGIDLSQEMLNEARNSPSLKRRLILRNLSIISAPGSSPNSGLMMRSRRSSMPWNSIACTRRLTAVSALPISL